MPKQFNFADEAKKADSGSYFKIQEGDNKIRLVTEFRLLEGSYQGKPTRKFVGFIIDRRDNAVKSAYLARTIIDQIADLQASEDYKFEHVPMPYDVNIRAKGAGTKEVVYNTLPTPAKPLTEQEIAAIEKVNVDELMAELQKPKEGESESETLLAEKSAAEKQEIYNETFGADEVSVEDIPFK